MKKENNFDFRKELSTVHKPNLRQDGVCPKDGDVVLSDGLCINISDKAGLVVTTAARDFADFMLVSMGISAQVTQGEPKSTENTIIIRTQAETDADLGDYAQYKGFRIDIDGGVKICGYDERGCAQGLYHLEEMMTLRKAPYLEKSVVLRKPDFYPQMVHSGYGHDEFCDEYLARIAHEGRDAILIFVTGVNRTRDGYMDFNALVAQAAKYGLDVYAYSSMISQVNPKAPEALDFYNGLYGELFRQCPGFKGLVLVGESVGFPSDDPHVCFDVLDENGLPHGKPLSGYWPCVDYPMWLEMLKTVIYPHNPDADIIFWSYNWGRQPEGPRVELIKNLPKDISLQATFEMFDYFQLDDVTEQLSDYTIRKPGPGKYFLSEAKAAHENGIRLYSMTNTGGLTWDFGVIPYVPVPYQWLKRYEAMRKMKDTYGLSGIMESHHYGFYPSIISKFSKQVFTDRSTPAEVQLRRVLEAEYGAENAATVDEALKLWSEAFDHYTPTDNDMYGAARCGPSFPFCLRISLDHPKEEGLERWYLTDYDFAFPHEVTFDKGSPPTLKLSREIPEIQKMADLMDQGVKLLNTIENPNEELLRLINLGAFIHRCVITVCNAKKWYRLICKLKAQEEKEGYLAILSQMEALLEQEIDNAEKTIPLVEYDSRLGWEASQGYLCDAPRLRWKQKQVRYVIDTEISTLRKQAQR